LPLTSFSSYGEGAHAANKDLIGEEILIIEFHFDLRVTPGVASLTEKAMSGLFTLFWVLISLDVVEGGAVLNVILQRVGAHAI
jgi:hypothetical protein